MMSMGLSKASVDEGNAWTQIKIIGLYDLLVLL